MRQVKNFLEPLAQPWVRNIENSIEGLEGVQADIAESDRSQGVILRSVVDTVSELRTQQVSLGEQQITLEEQQGILEAQQTTLEEQQITLGEQQTTLEAQQIIQGEQQVTLGEHQVTLGEQQGILQAQQVTLGEQQDSLEAQQGILQAQQILLGEQQDELEAQQTTLTSTVDRLDGQVVIYTQSFTQYGAQTTDMDDSVSGGPEILFPKPAWASFGVLLAISRYQTSSTVPNGYVYTCDAVLRNTPIPVNFGVSNLQMTGGMHVLWSTENNSFTPIMSMSPIMVEVAGSAGIYLRIATSMRNTYNSAATFRYTVLWH